MAATQKELQQQIATMQKTEQDLQQQLADLQKVLRERDQQDLANLKKGIEALREQTTVGMQKTADAVREIADVHERVIVLIDRSNLDQTWRRVYDNVRPDYAKIVKFLVGSRTCKQVRVYYSDIDADMVLEAERADWQRRQDFYTWMHHQGWVLRRVTKKVYDGKPVEKGLDAALIRDMERLCHDNRCDTVVLVSGDADYCEVVRDVQENYFTRAEVAFFPNQTSRDLVQCAGKFVNLECAKDQIIRK